jgi:hypothetical protein
MPNCDYYATIEDHREVLDFLFEDGACDIFELSSDFEQPLRKFEAPEAILGEFRRVYPNGQNWDTVYLQLYVKGAGPAFKPRRVRLDPAKCNGSTYRYAAEGLGLV